MVQVAVIALMPSDLICALRLMIVDEPSAAPNTSAGRSAALAACAVRVSGDPGSSYKYALRLAQPMSGSAADRVMSCAPHRPALRTREGRWRRWPSQCHRPARPRQLGQKPQLSAEDLWPRQPGRAAAGYPGAGCRAAMVVSVSARLRPGVAPPRWLGCGRVH